MSTPQPLPKKKKKTNIIGQHVEEATEILKIPYSPTTAPDEWSVYGQHVANKLRGYHKKTSSIVQHLINNILFEADMGKHDETSYQFIQSSQPLTYQIMPLTKSENSLPLSPSHQDTFCKESETV